MANFRSELLRKITSLVLLLIPVFAFGQLPNDNCGGAIVLTNVISYCSADGQYSNVEAIDNGLGAASGWSSAGKDVWFRFTAVAYDVNISVTGNSVGTAGGTLQNPSVALYTTPDCSTFQQLIGSATLGNNVAALYKGGLVIGQIYYIRVSAVNNNTGTFKLCVNNYNPILKSGQDYGTASILCGKESFTQTDVTGAGTNNREAVGTCVDGFPEANTAWYKWTAANNGTLTFIITPTVTNNDIDWVLYDLGTVDNPANINAAHAVRCAAGSGVTNDRDFPSEPQYYKTGLDIISSDLSEAGGAGQGQNGFVKYLDMQQGHIYALLVNNFTSGNNGFTIDFGGTGEFLGPHSAFDMLQNQPCTVNQNFTFINQSTNYSRLQWSFGDDASIASASTAGPFTVSYSTPGIKTVVLEAYSSQGCFVVASKSFTVGFKPATPAIAINKLQFCSEDMIELSTPALANTSYVWTGPGNFSANQPDLHIPASGTFAAGTYTLIAMQGSCSSDAVSITVPPIIKNPIAAFRTVPTLPRQAFCTGERGIY